MHHADQCLPWREGSDHFLTQRLFFYPGDEVTDSRQCDIGLKQGQPDFSEHVSGVRLGQSRFAAHGLDDFGQTLGQVVKHENRATFRG